MTQISFTLYLYRRNQSNTIYNFSSVFTYDFIVANGEWGCWGPYSECSATCGNGTKTRARKCNNPPPSGGGSSCIGDMEEIKTCDAGYCPSECIEQTIDTTESKN